MHCARYALLVLTLLAASWTLTAPLYAQDRQVFEAGPPAEVVREAWALLAALGYEPGSTDDGSWNERLSIAYLTFLRDVALPPSKVLTPQGLRRLREVAHSEGAAGARASNETVPTSGPDRLHRAVIAGDIEGVRTLLSGGAPVDGRDGQGWTPLMHAANKGYVLLIEMLLQSGALPDVRAADGATALFIATMNAHPEVIAQLMRAGASVSIRGPRGLTAVDVARLVYGEKKDQRPIPDDAEVHALIAGMTWAEAVKQTLAGLKAKQQADPSVSPQQQGAEPQDAEQEDSSAAPSTGNAEAVEAALALTQAQRVSVQKALSELGFNVGSADSLFGRRTRAAIAAYQKAGNLSETGYLTQDQTKQLLVAGEEAARRRAEEAERKRRAEEEARKRAAEEAERKRAAEEIALAPEPLCRGGAGSPCWIESQNQPGCHVWIRIPDSQPNETITWSGACIDGIASGEGRMVRRYSGGKITYAGGLHDGKRHGRGTHTLPNGDRYEGEWRDDKRHGRGTYTWPNGNRYEGGWSNGKMHGFGTFTYSTGSRYEGNWSDDKPNGFGTASIRGEVYRGQWRDGCFGSWWRGASILVAEESCD